MAALGSRPTSGARCGCCRRRACPSSPVPRSMSTTTRRWTCSPISAPRAGCRRWRCRAPPWRAARARARRHRNRGVRLRQAAAGVFRALLHRAPLQPAQGRLPVPLPRPSGRAGAGHPRRRALPHPQRHPDAVGRRLQPDRRACGCRNRCANWASPACACRRSRATWGAWSPSLAFSTLDAIDPDAVLRQLPWPLARTAAGLMAGMHAPPKSRDRRHAAGST
jgi:hypothetical protein